MKDVTTSIMMVTYNRLDLTKKMLESLFATTEGFRLFIVDNGSSDGTVDYLREMQRQRPEIHEIMYNRENRGIAVGRNQGLLMADKHNDPYLSTVDNDVVFYKGWLKDCIRFLEVNQNYAVGLNFEGTEYPVKTINGESLQYKREGNLGTACTVFPRMLHEKIGFFTTEFGLYGEEDADYFFRARQAGYEMGYMVKTGKHLGEGDADQGPYREFKTKAHAKNLDQFRKNCADYVRRKKPLYITFKA